MLDRLTELKIFSVEFIWIVIAASGGIAKYLYEMQRSKRPFKIIELVAKAFIAGFSGWVFAHVAVMLNDSVDFQLIMCAIGGWMGADGLDFVWQNYVLKGMRKNPVE